MTTPDRTPAIGEQTTASEDREAVAWRLRRVGAEKWNLWDADPRADTAAYADKDKWEVQALSAHPTPEGE